MSANPIMNNFSPDGTTTYVIQDARVDNLDIPSAVKWTYDSSTGYMTFTGMSEDDGRQEVRLCL